MSFQRTGLPFHRCFGGGAGAFVFKKQRTDLKLGSVSDPAPALPWWKSAL